MGNPDLVVIINNNAYIISGTEYESRIEAIQIAIKKFDWYQKEIEKLCRENWKNADPDWFPEDIEKIQIYTI